MAFMVPYAMYYDVKDCADIDQHGYVCHSCGRKCKGYNPVASGEGTTTCLKCAPPKDSVGWHGCLTAPGYMDRTDWHGPYATAEEALKAVMEFYEVDENGDSEFDRQCIGSEDSEDCEDGS